MVCCLSLSRRKRCELSVQRTEEGALLHICSFPKSDVELFVPITLEVVKHETNTSLFRRTVGIEDHGETQHHENTISPRHPQTHTLSLLVSLSLYFVCILMTLILIVVIFINHPPGNAPAHNAQPEGPGLEDYDTSPAVDRWIN